MCVSGVSVSDNSSVHVQTQGHSLLVPVPVTRGTMAFNVAAPQGTAALRQPNRYVLNSFLFFSFI